MSGTVSYIDGRGGRNPPPLPIQVIPTPNLMGEIMDTWGILIFIVGLVLYFITKKNPFWLFICGMGAGIVLGAIGSYLIVMGMF